MASMVQANQTNRAAPTIKTEAVAAHQTSAEPLPHHPPRAVEAKSIYSTSRAWERTERIPLGIIAARVRSTKRWMLARMFPVLVQRKRFGSAW